MRRRLVAGIATAVLLGTVVGVGCGSPSIAGEYVNVDDCGEFLELNKDTTFFLREAGIGLHGDWEVKNGELRLYFQVGTVATARITGGSLRDEDGKVWVKEAELGDDVVLFSAKATGGAGGGTPAEVVKAFFIALSRERFEEAVSYYGPQTRSHVLMERERLIDEGVDKDDNAIWLEAMVNALMEGFPWYAGEEGCTTAQDMNCLEIVEERIAFGGMKAEVDYVIRCGGYSGESGRYLIKTDGAWLIGE